MDFDFVLSPQPYHIGKGYRIDVQHEFGKITEILAVAMYRATYVLSDIE